METFSALLAICAGNSPVPGDFPAQRPVRRSFDVFFDLRLNKRLSKQLWGLWFETLSRSLWRHCNALTILMLTLKTLQINQVKEHQHKTTEILHFGNFHKWNAPYCHGIFVLNDIYICNVCTISTYNMMTSPNGNIFRVTDPLCGEFTVHRWIPLTKASDAELWYFLWSASWINGWANTREASDLRRHCVHHDVTIMTRTID